MTAAVLDTMGFFAAARRVPEQAEAALLAAQDTALPDIGDATSVALLGAGAAGWSADVCAAAAASAASLPVHVVGGADVPAFVSPSTYVVALSLHGNEAHTVFAAAEASARGATVVVIAARGALVEWAIESGAAVVRLDAAIPHARAALGALTIAPLVALDRAGVLPGMELAIDRAIAQLHHRRDELAVDDNDAARLARRIGRSIPLIYGEGSIGALAARRWKQQCNANAKIPAFAGALPALAYDEIAGWGQHGDVTRQVLSAVLLRHQHEEPGSAARFVTLDEVLSESVSAVHEVEAKGEGALAQLLDLAYVGDVVSLNLAAQEELDPGPAPALELLW